MNLKFVMEKLEAYAVPEVVAKIKSMRNKGEANWMFDPEYENVAYFVAANGKTLVVLTFKDGEISDSEFQKGFHV